MHDTTQPVILHDSLTQAHVARISRTHQMGFLARVSSTNDVSHVLILLLPVQKLLNALIELGALKPPETQAWMITFLRDLAVALEVDPDQAPILDCMLTMDPKVFETFDLTSTALVQRLVKDAEQLCPSRRAALELALEAARSVALVNLETLASTSDAVRTQLWGFVNGSYGAIH